MSPADPRLERLVQAYLDGILSPAETTELTDLLVRDPAAADAFARAVRFEALLQTHLTEEKQVREWSLATDGEPEIAEREVVARPARRGRWTAAAAILATAALLLVAIRWWSSEPRAQAVVHQVVAGRVLVDGIEAKSFVDGSRLEVMGSLSAAFHLADGNDFELMPATSAVVRREGGEAIVKLDYGNGKFRGMSSQRPLRVDTPLGAVSGRAADFAVDLQPQDDLEPAASGENGAEVDPDEPATFETSLPAFLIVAVLAGQVEVQEADQKVKVSAGESRAFAQEKIPAFAGKIVDISGDGKRLTLEGKRPKPGAPLPRRDVSITADTKLTYYGAALGDDRPTVGAWALATLDKSSPETAVAIEFGNRSPTFSGTVRAVSADGRRLTIEIYRKGDKPLERTITLDDRTRTSFHGFDSNDIQATVGYQAGIWLADEADRAAEVRFAFKTKGPIAKPTGDTFKNPPTKKSGSKPDGKLDPKKDGKPAAKPIDKSLKSNEKPTKPEPKFDKKQEPKSSK
jgi:hypothetical protein